MIIYYLFEGATFYPKSQAALVCLFSPSMYGWRPQSLLKPETAKNAKMLLPGRKLPSLHPVALLHCVRTFSLPCNLHDLTVPVVHVCSNVGNGEGSQNIQKTLYLTSSRCLRATTGEQEAGRKLYMSIAACASVIFSIYARLRGNRRHVFGCRGVCRLGVG